MDCARAAASATAAAAGAVAGAFGWAVTSLKSRLYKEGPMEAAEASPSVSSASAPHAAANASTSRSLFASNASPELPVVPISARAGDSGWDMDDTFGGDDWDEPLAAASTAPKKLSPQAPSARTTFTKKASPPASRLEVKHSEPASDGDGWDSFDADLPAVKPKAVMLVSATAPAALSAEERRAQLAAKREERRKTLEQAGKARGVSAEVPEPVAAPAAAEPVVAAPVMKRTGMSLKSKAAVPAMPGEVEKPIAKKLASAPVDGWDDF